MWSHGTRSGYSRHKCKCELCVEASRVDGKRNYERHKASILARNKRNKSDKVHQQELQLSEVQAKATEFATQAADKRRRHLCFPRPQQT